MITNYLRNVVERLSQLPAPVQDQYAAEIERGLDELERSAASAVPGPSATPAAPAAPAAPEPVDDPVTDPLAQFIGFVQSRTPDLAARHDTYLAQTYADDHKPINDHNR